MHHAAHPVLQRRREDALCAAGTFAIDLHSTHRKADWRVRPAEKFLYQRYGEAANSQYIARPLAHAAQFGIMSATPAQRRKGKNNCALEPLIFVQGRN